MWVRHLCLSERLRGHNGCINRLEWNKDGSFLASVSDDTSIMLWPYPRQSFKTFLVPTLHENNVFGVKFLPNTNSSILVTAASDDTVQLHRLAGVSSLVPVENRRRGVFEEYAPVSGRDVETLVAHTAVYRCHSAYVYHVEVSNHDPCLFWSSSLDGDVRQYDFRVRNQLQSRPESSNVLVSLRNRSQHGVQAVSVNPAKPELMAVAGPDQYVRIYDRRRLDLSTRQEKRGSLAPDQPVLSLGIPQFSIPKSYYYPFSIYPSYVSFNSRGDKVLAMYYGHDAMCWTGLTSDEASAQGVVHAPRHEDSDMSDFVPEDCYTVRPNNQKPLNTEENAKADGMLSAMMVYVHAVYRKALQSTGFIRYISKVLNSYPGHAASHNELAKAYLDRGWTTDKLEALGEAQIAVDLDPRNVEYYKVLLRCLEECGFQLSVVCLYDYIVDVFGNLDQECTRRYLYCMTLLVRENGAKATEYIATAKQGELIGEDVETLSTFDKIYAYLWFQKNAHAPRDVQQSPLLLQGFQSTKHLVQTYRSHSNTRTLIKEAVFLGENDEFVAAGSDSGHVYVYETETGECVSTFDADEDITNCVRPHPFMPVIATSGIEDTVKVWTPLEGDEGIQCVSDPITIDEIVSKKERKGDFTLLTSFDNSFEEDFTEDMQDDGTIHQEDEHSLGEELMRVVLPNMPQNLIHLLNTLSRRNRGRTQQSFPYQEEAPNDQQDEEEEVECRLQ